MIVTASSIPPTMMLQNTMNALSSCWSVLTSLFGFLIFIFCIGLVIVSMMLTPKKPAPVRVRADGLLWFMLGQRQFAIDLQPREYPEKSRCCLTYPVNLLGLG